LRARLGGERRGMLELVVSPLRPGGHGGTLRIPYPKTRLVAGTLAALCALVLGGCSRQGRKPVDLVGAEASLVEASVAGRDRTWIVGQTGKQVRIDDEVRRTVPASPPSRLRYTVEIPARARLNVALGIAEERHGQPAVEFVIKVRQDGREKTVLTQLMDPIQRPVHRRWLPAEVDLAAYAGKAEIVFETRGFDEDPEDSRRAFWGTPAITAPDDAAPLVVIYLVDTLRADHTTPYGYARDTTPELAEFAKDAVVFESAVAQGSWTKPSVASLFTSLLPGRHRAVQLRDSLDPGHVTLAEMLQAKGYATGAAIANSIIYLQGVNFDQGFDFFDGIHGAEKRPSKMVDAAGVVDGALEWLDERRGFPGFLYVHTVDPHVPYTPPPPYDRMYEPHPTAGHLAVDPRNDYHEALDRDRFVAQYDGEIAYGDREFGRFIDELKKRGLYDRALIVFMADHGEEFQDHGGWLHGRSVYDELIRIPLIVKFPERRDAGRRVAQQVQEVDILPTILESMGLPVPAPPIIAGRPLQPVIRGEAPEPPAVAEISHRGYVAHGMRTGKDKYIRVFSPAQAEMYFDLVRDPKESVNRLEQNRERSRLLRAGLEEAMVENPYRNVVRVAGAGAYELKLSTEGWIQGVETADLGPAESYNIEGNGRKLYLHVRPRPGRPREVSFTIRPMGAPVFLEGTRDGRPLEPADVSMAAEGIHPAAFPAKLPDIEPQDASDEEKPDWNVLGAPPADRPGVHLWLVMAPGRKVMDLDKDTRERLKALGYLGN
jgi:arylsulfatase A-like enzyme